MLKRDNFSNVEDFLLNGKWNNRLGYYLINILWRKYLISFSANGIIFISEGI